MIARNGVILIDQIETVRAEGRAIWDALVEAAMSRFRPIMLTAISTVLGLIPIAPTIFWGPMAYAIMGGLLVATLLTLLFLPALYVAWFRVKEPSPASRADTHYLRRRLDASPLASEHRSSLSHGRCSSRTQIADPAPRVGGRSGPRRLQAVPSTAGHETETALTGIHPNVRRLSPPAW
jgi:AcrB/AcrD/AcrF family